MSEPTNASELFSPENVKRRWPNILRDEPQPTHEEIEASEKARCERFEREKEARRQLAGEQFLKERGARYRNCRLSNFECNHKGQREAIEQLRSYLENIHGEVKQGNGVVLFGPSGSGKDHLLVALAFAAIRGYGRRAIEADHYRDSAHGKNGFSLVWKNGVELFAEMRATIDGEQSEASILDPMIRADILILSDPLPPEGELTKYQRETLYRVLEARYSACRPTWATLNVSGGKEAGERLGVPNYDRLRDGALCVFCDWPSYRKPRP